MLLLGLCVCVSADIAEAYTLQPTAAGCVKESKRKQMTAKRASRQPRVRTRRQKPRRPSDRSAGTHIFTAIGDAGHAATYIFIVVKGVEHVVGQTGEQVDDEPRLEVVHADDLRITDHLAAGADERRVEVQHDIYKENHVHNRVHHEQADVLGRLVLERDVVRHHDGGVEGETEDHPVPDGFEGTVVEEDVRRRLGRLLAVLRQHVRAERHHLQDRARCQAGVDSGT